MSKWVCLPRYGEFEIVCGRDGRPRVLGEGSFGKTFEAFREDSVAGGMIREYAALKVLNPALLGSETKRFQFLQELTALTKLKHANLIHYIRCGEESGQVFYAMELCRGGDLSQLVNRLGPLSERTAALIGLQIATGLKEVHRQRLIHRDIKPSNIMLVDEIPDGTNLAELDSRLAEQESLCRIVDFGLVDFAVGREDDQVSLPRQRFVGSPMFASPEQICERPVDGRSDLYSLGMTLWFLVLGRGPLTDLSGRVLQSERDVLRTHVEPTEYIDRLPGFLSNEFRQLLATLLAKKPEQRFASAIEVQQALRNFLDRPSSQQFIPAFSVQATSQQIDQVFRFHGTPLTPRLGLRRYEVENIHDGDTGYLFIVQDKETNPDALAHRVNLSTLGSYGELSQRPDFPPTILKITHVVDAVDALCCVEEIPPAVTLADVLRVRGRSRPFSFREAATLLDPIASSLDFLLQNSKEKVFIPCEEIFVEGDGIGVESKNLSTIGRPLTEWQNFRVVFSMLWLEQSNEDNFDPTSTMSWSSRTMSGSMQITDSGSHPVRIFCRLVYRMMSGSEVAAAAEYTPHAYMPVVELSAASNNLLRDILSGQTSVHEVSEVFGQLCMHEALPRPNRTATRTRTSRNSAMGTSTGAGFGSATGIGLGASAGTTSAHASGPAYRSASASRSYEGGGSGSTYGSVGSSMGSMDYRRDLPVAEVVSPGVVISPFDSERRPIRLNADQWKESAPIICPYGQRPFKLPSRLDPLDAIVIEPGLIASPFDPNGHGIRVPWEDWQPGRKFVCRVSGKPFALPYDLPWPEGIIPSNSTQQAISPYNSAAVLTDIPLRDWTPGGVVHCPITGYPFLLPADLPPPFAVVAPNLPGEIASPYSPTIRWTIEPAQWIPGARHICRATQHPFVLPEDILRWPAPNVAVIDADKRLVSSPFAASRTFTVPSASWRPGFRVDCPVTGRKVALPNDLPTAIGEVVPGKMGVLRSPYTGEEFSVDFNDWHENAEITCPGTRSRVRLPSSLPAWILTAELVPEQPGKAINPHTKAVIDVPPQQWNEGQKLTCPITGKDFQLPATLPPLRAMVEPGRFGIVRSPYSEKTTIEVDINDWNAGKQVKCPASGKALLLPTELPEWLAEATFIERQPGKVRSPYGPKAPVDISAEQWRAGAKATCPTTKRNFLLPDVVLPSLEQERRIVDFAYSEPELGPAEAAIELSKNSPDITAEAVQAVWNRHQLSTVELRRTTLETAEAMQAQPGYVRSPYGSRPTVKVPPARWVETGATMHCPDTGRRFLLPVNLPALQAKVTHGQPGKATSPFAEEKGTFDLTPDEWLPHGKIVCPFTNNALVLPPDLPRWTPVATLDEKEPGTIRSPYLDHKPVQITGTDWKPNNVLRCPYSNRDYALPDQLSPLLGLNPQNGSIESPYQPGTRFSIHANDWLPGHRVTCPATRLPIQLPAELPESAWFGEVLQPGLVRSPFGRKPSVKVAPTQWAAGGRITCPETKRPFQLPEPLLPLDALVRQGKTGVVHSPYSPSTDIQVPVEHWEVGRLVICPATQRECRLPNNLPTWVGIATVITDKPSWVSSPYSLETEVQVPPTEWKAGHTIRCPKVQRDFKLPSDLPPLAASIVDGARAKVQSPYDPSGPPQDVDPSLWKPSQRIKCARTKLEFALPSELPSLAFEAVLISGQAGKVLSPYGKRSEVNISGPDWEIGKRIACPETSHQFILPTDLTPMTASIVAGELGKITTPYADNRQVAIKHSDWVSEKVIDCPITHRPLKLPADLPVWEKKSTPWLLIILGGIAIFIIAFLATYFFTPPKTEKKQPPTVPAQTKAAPAHALPSSDHATASANTGADSTPAAKEFTSLISLPWW